MSRIHYDEYTTIPTVPLSEQSHTQRILKEFVQTCQCPDGWPQETCFANMNKQSGDPILEQMPTGAIFSIADDRQQCTLDKRRAAPLTIGIARPFEQSFMNQDLTFTLGRNPPQGFDSNDFRGEARWQDGDDRRVGTFWKAGPRAGMQANLNATGTAPLPFPIPPSNSGFIVDVPKLFDYGAYIRYPNAYPLSRAIN